MWMCRRPWQGGYEQALDRHSISSFSSAQTKTSTQRLNDPPKRTARGQNTGLGMIIHSHG
jgi:hypothetical protein